MYKSIQEIKKKNQESGGLWFSRDAMEFFRTRIESKVIDGKYFIYSIQESPMGDRYYKTAFADDGGRVHLIGPTLGYSTPLEAIKKIEDNMSEFGKFLN